MQQSVGLEVDLCYRIWKVYKAQEHASFFMKEMLNVGCGGTRATADITLRSFYQAKAK